MAAEIKTHGVAVEIGSTKDAEIIVSGVEADIGFTRPAELIVSMICVEMGFVDRVYHTHGWLMIF